VVPELNEIIENNDYYGPCEYNAFLSGYKQADVINPAIVNTTTTIKNVWSIGTWLTITRDTGEYISVPKDIISAVALHIAGKPRTKDNFSLALGKAKQLVSAAKIKEHPDLVVTTVAVLAFLKTLDQDIALYQDLTSKTRKFSILNSLAELKPPKLDITPFFVTIVVMGFALWTSYKFDRRTFNPINFSLFAAAIAVVATQWRANYFGTLHFTNVIFNLWRRGSDPQLYVTDVCCEETKLEKIHPKGEARIIYATPECHANMAAYLLGSCVKGYEPVFPRPCQHNEYVGVVNRCVGAPMTDISTIHNQVAILMNNYKKYPFFIEPKELETYPYHLWLKRFPGPRQNQIETAKNLYYDSIVDWKFMSYNDTMVKIEGLFKSNFGVVEFTPRVVHQRKAMFQYLTGPFTYTVSKYFLKKWHSQFSKHCKIDCNYNHQVVYTSSMSAEDIGQWFDITLLWAGPNPTILEDDFSRFDSTQEQDLLKWQISYINQFMENNEMTPDIKTAMTLTSITKGVTRHGVLFSCPGKFKSGEGHTSVGNTITNFNVHHTAIMEVMPTMVDNYRMIGLGDDNLLIMKHSKTIDVSLNTSKLSKSISKFGLKPKLKIVTKYSAEYCSGRFYPTSEGVSVWGPKIGRIIGKTFWRKRLDTTKVTDKQWLKGVALGFYQDVQHVPILKNFVNRILYLTQDVDAEMIRDEYKIHSTRVHNFNDDTIFMLCEVYGITPDQIRSLCDYFDNANFPLIIDNPIFTIIMQIDGCIPEEDPLLTQPTHVHVKEKGYLRKLLNMWKEYKKQKQLYATVGIEAVKSKPLVFITTVIIAPVVEELFKWYCMRPLSILVPQLTNDTVPGEGHFKFTRPYTLDVGVQFGTLEGILDSCSSWSSLIFMPLNIFLKQWLHSAICQFDSLETRIVAHSAWNILMFSRYIGFGMLKYGLYCGPGWSDGKEQNSVVSYTPAIDEFDQTCKEHDAVYAQEGDLHNADQVFYDANFGKGITRTTAALLVKGYQIYKGPKEKLVWGKDTNLSEMTGNKKSQKNGRTPTTKSSNNKAEKKHKKKETVVVTLPPPPRTRKENNGTKVTKMSRYVTAPVAAFDLMGGNKFRENQRKSERLTGSVILTTIKFSSTDVEGQVNYVIDITPKFLAPQTRMAINTQLYERIRCNSLSFRYVNSSSSQTSGQFVGFFDPDPADGWTVGGILNLQKLSDMQFKFSGAYWNNLNLGPIKNPSKEPIYSNRDTSTPANSAEERQTSFGQLVIGVVVPIGTTATTGSIYMDYDFTYMQSVNEFQEDTATFTFNETSTSSPPNFNVVSAVGSMTGPLGFRRSGDGVISFKQPGFYEGHVQVPVTSGVSAFTWTMNNCLMTFDGEFGGSDYRFYFFQLQKTVDFNTEASITATGGGDVLTVNVNYLMTIRPVVESEQSFLIKKNKLNVVPIKTLEPKYPQIVQDVIMGESDGKTEVQDDDEEIKTIRLIKLLVDDKDRQYAYSLMVSGKNHLVAREFVLKKLSA